MLRNKHFKVIFFSLCIITIVILSTLGGYSLFVQWEADSSFSGYQGFIYAITSEIYRNEITVHNVSVKTGDEAVIEGAPKGIPVLVGKIKNNSQKTITSLLVEVSFSRPDGSVIYRDWIYPLDRDIPARTPFFSGIKKTSGTLPPGENMYFRHTLGNCPHELLSGLETKGSFAKTGPKQSIKINTSVRGASIL